MRAKKEALVDSYKKIFDDSSILLVVRYSGVTVAEFNSLRKTLRASGSKAVVVKNTLAKLAAAANTAAKEIQNEFSGPVLLFYSSDAIGLSKSVVEFAEKNSKKMLIQAGLMDGKFLDAESITSLSKLPSLAELRAKIVATIAAPARNLASIVYNVPASVARVIKAKSEQ